MYNPAFWMRCIYGVCIGKRDVYIGYISYSLARMSESHARMIFEMDLYQMIYVMHI